MLNFKHVNRPTECKVAFCPFIIKVYTFPKGGEAFLCIFICMFIAAFASVTGFEILVEFENMF